MSGSLFGYNEKCSFGKITFNTTLQNPEIKFEIISIDDEVIHTHIIKKSELK
jgi:alkaline phosphatase D